MKTKFFLIPFLIIISFSNLSFSNDHWDKPLCKIALNSYGYLWYKGFIKKCHAKRQGYTSVYINDIELKRTFNILNDNYKKSNIYVIDKYFTFDYMKKEHYKNKKSWYSEGVYQYEIDKLKYAFGKGYDSSKDIADSEKIIRKDPSIQFLFSTGNFSSGLRDACQHAMIRIENNSYKSNFFIKWGKRKLEGVKNQPKFKKICIDNN